VCRPPHPVMTGLRPVAIVPLIAWTMATASFAEPRDAAALFAPDRVIPVEVALSAEDWESLRRESRDAGFLFSAAPPRKFTWHRGDATVDGAPMAGVGLRKKGFLGSLDSARPSLIVDYRKYGAVSPFAGLGRVTLNNNKQDASCIGQFLAYKLFAAAGVPAPRAGFATVTVNGTALGVYTIVESIKPPFLERVFGSADGGLYEGTVADLVPASLDKLEVETHDRFRPTLEALASLLAADEAVDTARIGDLVDLDTFISYWAVEALVGIWDGYSGNQNNYFVHISADDRTIRFVPWGTDSAFTSIPGPLAAFNRRAAPAIMAEAALANRLAFAPGIVTRYKTRLEELLATVWNEEALLAEVDRIEALIRPHLAPSQAGAGKALDAVRDFIRRRRGELTTALADWPPNLPSRPRPPLTVTRVGTVAGTFTARQRAVDDDQTPDGEVDLAIVMRGEAVPFIPASVRVYPTPLPGPAGRPGAPPPPAADGPGAAQGAIGVTVSGTRGDGTPLSLSFFLDRRLVRDSTDDLESGGMLAVGGGFFGNGPMRVLGGTVSLTDRGVAPGSTLAGRFSFSIDESSGGFNNPAPRQRPPATAADEP